MFAASSAAMILDAIKIITALNAVVEHTGRRREGACTLNYCRFSGASSGGGGVGSRKGVGVVGSMRYDI